MRKRIYEIIEQGHSGDKASIAYDIFMLVAISASIIPLMFFEENAAFLVIEHVTVTFFILDYILRWITADFRLQKKGWSFVLYPFTGWAIIDLLSILPGLHFLGRGFKILRVMRMLRILRLFKFIRYSSKIRALGRVIRKERDVLFSVLGIAMFYVFLTALIMFNVEPQINPETGAVTFEHFFDALYWATVTLTTVGYGDMIPVTDIGRFVSMLSSLFGVAIIALPSGVITASYLEELRADRNAKNKKIEVVAAIIRKGDKVFSTQRGYGDYKDWWEFPGGKMEAGEKQEDALVREIREELSTEISVDKYLTTVDYDYPKFHLTMHCYMCSLRSEALHLNEHEAARWLGADELNTVKWLPADEGLLPLIKKEL